LEIADAIPGFTYGTIESFVRRNLYPGIAVDSHSIVEADEPIAAHVG